MKKTQIALTGCTATMISALLPADQQSLLMHIRIPKALDHPLHALPSTTKWIARSSSDTNPLSAFGSSKIFYALVDCRHDRRQLTLIYSTSNIQTHNSGHTFQLWRVGCRWGVNGAQTLGAAHGVTGDAAAYRSAFVQGRRSTQVRQLSRVDVMTITCRMPAFIPRVACRK